MAESLLPAVQPGRQASPPAVLLVTQVGRKHEQALTKRDKEDDHDHDGDHLEDPAHRAGDEIEWHEHDDVCQDAEDNRQGHLTGALDGGLDERHTLLVIVVDVFAHHDGIVHHDAQGDDVGKQRYHVDRHARRGQEQKRPQERNRDAHHHPEGQPRLQEKPQDDQNQPQAQGPVAQQKLHALAVDVRPVMTNSRLDAPRKACPHGLKATSNRI